MPSPRVADPTDPADVAALARLRRSWYAEWHPDRDEAADPRFEDRFAAWLAGEGERRVCWLARGDDGSDRDVGMLSLVEFTRMPWPDPDARAPSRRWGYVSNVFVEADHRRRGLGRALLDAAVAHADAAGHARLVLAPSEEGRRLYESAGFGPADALLLRPGAGP